MTCSKLLVVFSMVFAAAAVSNSEPASELKTGDFKWVASEPVLESTKLGQVQWIAVKDPTVVRYKGQWHLFVTVRGIERSHAVVYVTFKDWSKAKETKQQVLQCHSGFFCAPQVFYFAPHKTWYMLCQASDESWEPKYGPAYSTTQDISKPDSWSKLTPIFDAKPAGIEAWLDFWIICDDSKAYLFFTFQNILQSAGWRNRSKPSASAVISFSRR
ncbi:MAG: hypothetical protein JW720_03005, partial [Sedimentisphaerales bacterium]|nr:hypothetical protein [Sedimentisphaerales bacterium]